MKSPRQVLFRIPHSPLRTGLFIPHFALRTPHWLHSALATSHWLPPSKSLQFHVLYTILVAYSDETGFTGAAYPQSQKT